MAVDKKIAKENLGKKIEKQKERIAAAKKTLREMEAQYAELEKAVREQERNENMDALEAEMAAKGYEGRLDPEIIAKLVEIFDAEEKRKRAAEAAEGGSGDGAGGGDGAADAAADGGDGPTAPEPPVQKMSKFGAPGAFQQQDSE